MNKMKRRLKEAFLISVLLVIYGSVASASNMTCSNNCKVPQVTKNSNNKYCHGKRSKAGVNFKRKSNPIVKEWKFCKKSCLLSRACKGRAVPTTNNSASQVNDKEFDKIYALVKKNCVSAKTNLEFCLAKQNSLFSKVARAVDYFKNWFALKDYFLNLDQLPNQDRNVTLMLTFIAYRKIVTQKILAHIIKSKYKKSSPIRKSPSFLEFSTNRSKKSKCFLKRINFFAGGSVTPVSDIDIMVQTGQSSDCPDVGIDLLLRDLKLQIEIVRDFNSYFEEKYKVPSGLYFDVNLYIADKDLWRLRESFAFTPPNKQAVIASGWYALKRTLLKQGVPPLKVESLILDHDQMHPNFDPKVMNALADKWIAQTSAYGTLKKRNEAYLRKMEEIHRVLSACSKNPAASICHTYKEKLVLAMIYANEAYYSPGALLFHLGFQGREEKSSCSLRAGALMQNIAYAVEHYEPEIKGGKLEEIGLLKAAKYIDRVGKILYYRNNELTSLENLMHKYKEFDSVELNSVKTFFESAAIILGIKKTPNFAKEPIFAFDRANLIAQQFGFNKQRIISELIPVGIRAMRACHWHKLSSTGGGRKQPKGIR